MPAELEVRAVQPGDAGKRQAYLDREVMQEEGIEKGEIIRIKGDTDTVARAVPGYQEDVGQGVIRIDGNMRNNAGTGIEDTVEIEAVDASDAEQVVLSPVKQSVQIVRGGERYLQRALQNIPLSKGDQFRLKIISSPITLKVTETAPDDPVVVGRRTEVRLSQEPASAETEAGLEEAVRPDVTYEDIGGLDQELEQVREMIEMPLRTPEIFEELAIEPPTGVILHGPPGTGKTLIAKAVANEVDAHFIPVSGPEIMSKYYGESEGQLRELFEEAEENAPAIIFFDELDAIAPGRGDSDEMERRLVAQLLSLMDGLESREDVIVIGATNRLDAVDPALRRGGRFDREIEIGVPDKKGRHEILQIHTRGMPYTDEIDLEEYAERTHGFVGADLESLTKEAAMSAVRRVRPDIDLEEGVPADVLEDLEVRKDDFEDALNVVEPSAMREFFVEIPDVTYDDVGGLDDTKKELVETIEWPLQHDELFDHLDTEAPSGMLLYGPPGTGKTLLAKAVANASDANFIPVKGPELLNKYVGESEKAVREVFEKARQNSPAVIFFDEIDAIAGERDSGGVSSEASERVVSQLLTELDGIEALENVVVIATTNRPDMIDTALLRPGRLDRLVEVPVPDEAAREEIFRIHLSGTPTEDVDVAELAEQTDGFTGSDIEAVCREASMFAMDQYLEDREREDVGDDLETLTVTGEHLQQAIEKVGPSLGDEERERYEEMAEAVESMVEA
ncbi:MAG: CDC48 family AAA ATPase [Candidatus Nanohaloarchaea archaeon]|nr:CDC48 family AAA ATPase [Candidatus Nanohaloarchaea archaeon]